LAHEYDRLLAELKIEPLVRPIYADAERLVEQFGQNSYDIVHGQNCIDHTANPTHAIEQMLAVSKPQGFVVLCHAENEGKREQYQQLHQWDFTCESGSFVIGDRRGMKIDMTKRLASYCEIECTRNGEVIITGIRKKMH
jgi:ubiquinone/menaquinone biosynthesis C-methylase UbiE